MKLKPSFEPKESPREERRRYAPGARWYRYPACLFSGHDRPFNEKGWQAIHCARCGQSMHHLTLGGVYARGIFRFQLFLVNLANSLERDKQLTHYPHFRGVDTKLLKNLGTKHSCDAYSYEGLVSLNKQYKDDGLPPLTVDDLLDESGWVDINDGNAEEMTDMINKSLEAESNRQERERTMKAAGLK